MCSNSQGHYGPRPERVVCKCGKGYGHWRDELCRYCREKTVSRAEAKELGVRSRGQGLGYEDLYPVKPVDPFEFQNLDEEKEDE